MAFVHRDTNHDAVAEHARAAGDGTAITATLADHGRGFTRDGSLVHAGDALDHVTVSGDDIISFTNNAVPFLQFIGGDFFFTPIAQAAGDGVLAGLAQTFSLCFAASFGDGFGKIGEEHGEPEPDRQLGDETALG